MCALLAPGQLNRFAAVAQVMPQQPAHIDLVAARRWALAAGFARLDPPGQLLQQRLARLHFFPGEAAEILGAQRFTRAVRELDLDLLLLLGLIAAILLAILRVRPLP